MYSYFFVPGNKTEFLRKIPEIKSDYFIIDLEDSVNPEDILNSIENILEFEINNSSYVRFPFNHDNQNYQHLKMLLNEGFGKFVLPKIDSVGDIESIYSDLSRISPSNNNNFEFIVLIENPSALLNIHEILNHRSVIGTGLGSHDYCSAMRMKHTQENIYWAKMQVLNYAKVTGKLAIDIASMNIRNKKEFADECKLGFGQGFDAKFLIHPSQLEIFNSIKFYTSNDVKIALGIKEHISEIGGIEKFNVFEIEGQVIERPHLSYYNFVLEKSNHGTL